MPFVHIEPQECLSDEVVSISFTSLNPHAEYTVAVTTKDERGKDFVSYAHFLSNEFGMIDVNKDTSFGGSFTGSLNMGLIGSLAPASHEFKFLRYLKKDVTSPSKIEICLYKGYHSADALYTNASSKILSGLHIRHYMAKGVQRIMVKHGRVRGTLFIPSGDGPFPGVVDIFGTAGGLLEYRSCLLASRGIIALALAYFAYDDLPQEMTHTDLHYFEEAVQYLINHPKVCKPYIGAIGVSKGGDIVNAMGSFLPQVSLVVCINGCLASTANPTIYKDITVPALDFETARAKIINKELLCGYELTNDPQDYPETIYPIEKSKAHFLFLVSGDDRNWKAPYFAELAAQRMNKAENLNYKVCIYKGAGHLLEPPYMPFCYVSYHKMFDAPLLWGGNLKDHMEAQEQSWKEMLHTIKSRLGYNVGKL